MSVPGADTSTDGTVLNLIWYNNAGMTFHFNPAHTAHREPVLELSALLGRAGFRHLAIVILRLVHAHIHASSRAIFQVTNRHVHHDLDTQSLPLNLAQAAEQLQSQGTNLENFQCQGVVQQHLHKLLLLSQHKQATFK